jgi:hypothetical protein
MTKMPSLDENSRLVLDVRVYASRRGHEVGFTWFLKDPQGTPGARCVGGGGSGDYGFMVESIERQMKAHIDAVIARGCEAASQATPSFMDEVRGHRQQYPMGCPHAECDVCAFHAPQVHGRMQRAHRTASDATVPVVSPAEVVAVITKRDQGPYCTACGVAAVRCARAKREGQDGGCCIACHHGPRVDTVCYRGACRAPAARWWNASTRQFYCEPCARQINEHSPGLCVEMVTP